jgi:DME family drug/metabolite transporter
MGGPWLVLASAVLWGTTGTAQAFAPAGAQPSVVGAVRLALGGLALLVLALVRGSLHRARGWPILALLLASGSMAAYQPFFFTAVTRTGVAIGTVVAIGSAPILAGVLGFLVRGERPGRRWPAATALAILGCSLLVTVGGGLTVDAGGVVLALCAGLAYATYVVASKRLLEDGSPDAVMAVVFCLGAVFLSPLLFAGDLRWLAQPRGLAVALHLGLIATAGAYVLFARGLGQVPVAMAVTLSLAEPLTAAALGLLVLGEHLTVSAALGGGLVLSGLIWLAAGTWRPAPANYRKQCKPITDAESVAGQTSKGELDDRDR